MRKVKSKNINHNFILYKVIAKPSYTREFFFWIPLGKKKNVNKSKKVKIYIEILSNILYINEIQKSNIKWLHILRPSKT